MAVPIVKEVEGFKTESTTQPSQVTYPYYPIYPYYGISSYAPMFLDLMFGLLFLLLPLMLLIPIFKSLTGALAG